MNDRGCGLWVTCFAPVNMKTHVCRAVNLLSNRVIGRFGPTGRNLNKSTGLVNHHSSPLFASKCIQDVVSCHR
eukprot:m.170128 g.170128  ORF g.170128 m.170128 type:complete len:73 (-) comp18259_c0_seq4:714-932(-)